MTDVEVINLHLSHIGNTNAIADVDEDSEEARISRRWLSVAHGELLSKRYWKFARKTKDLALIEENPTTEWLFSYRQPSDCIMARKIPVGSTTGSAVFDNNFILPDIPFDKSFDDDGDLIYTNIENAALEYTARRNVSGCPIYYCIALSYLLATYTFESLSKGDMMGSSAKIQKKYEDKLDEASSKNDNETVDTKTNESALTLARK